MNSLRPARIPLTSYDNVLYEEILSGRVTRSDLKCSKLFYLLFLQACIQKERSQFVMWKIIAREP